MPRSDTDRRVLGGADIDSRNPYTAPSIMPLALARTTRAVWFRIAWGVVVLVVASLFALTQFEELRVARALTSSDSFVVLLFAPPIVWDAFCRASARPRGIAVIICEWLFRCCMVYFATFMLTFIAFGFVTGVGPLRWSNGAFQVTISPEFRTRYSERAFTIAVSIVIAALVVAFYDRLVSRKQSKNTITG